MKPIVEWAVEMRKEFLNEFNKLRTELQHPKRARSNTDVHYSPKYMEKIFQGTCWTIENIVIALISLKLPSGLAVVTVGDVDESEGYDRRYRLGVLTNEEIKSEVR